MKYCKRSKIKTLLLAFSLFTTTLYASDEDILASISSAMSHYEEVATITKDNERYQPYIISVFEGKDLEKLGIKDLEEALGLVPGVDMASDNFYNKTPIFRGSNPRAYGQSKLFIDGTLVNEVFFDSYTQYLSMPIEMIKRIEVTRGPGSKTDGVNAYAGSINIITYSEEFEGFESKDKIVLKSGSYDYIMGGFVKSFDLGDFKLHTDFYYQQDDKKLKAGPDGYSLGSSSLPGLDNTDKSRDGEAPIWIKNWNLGLKLDYKDFYIKARNLDHTQGSGYGINWFLPNDDDRQKLPSQYIEAGYDGKADNFEISIKAGIKNDAWDSDAQLSPEGWNFINYEQLVLQGTIAPVTFSDGTYGEHSAYQQTLYNSAFIRYKGVEDHKVSAGFRYFKEDTYSMTSKFSDWNTGDVTPIENGIPFFEKDAKRETNIFSLQDEFYASDALSLIYGISYEDTTYTDGVIDPRVSLVYQSDAENIYKFIYSQSHRNPSWQEMYTRNNTARTGTTDLDPERVNAYEAAYIHKFSSDSHLQSNLFYLENKDQIYSSSPPEFKNEMDTTIYGLELEYKGQLSSSDQLYLNYALVDGKDKDHNYLPNVAKHLVKGYYIYNFSDYLSLSGVARYVGEKQRIGEYVNLWTGTTEKDTRDEVKSYVDADMAVSYYDRKNDYHITLSAKNILASDIRYPSPPPPDTYIDDYRQEGTNFLLTISKEY